MDVHVTIERKGQGCILQTKRYTKADQKAVVQILKSGGIVAFPSDTVYGLGALYGNLDALNRLKAAKGRDERKPIPVMISNKEQLAELGVVSDAAKRLADAFMPGGLTLILAKRPEVADAMTNGFPTIALRMSDDPWLCELIQACGKPLLVSSANLSGAAPGKDGASVLQQLEGRIDAIVMGETHGSLPSTIMDMSSDPPRLIRAGVIKEQAINEILYGK